MKTTTMKTTTRSRGSRAQWCCRRCRRLRRWWPRCRGRRGKRRWPSEGGKIFSVSANDFIHDALWGNIYIYIYISEPVQYSVLGTITHLKDVVGDVAETGDIGACSRRDGEADGCGVVLRKDGRCDAIAEAAVDLVGRGVVFEYLRRVLLVCVDPPTGDGTSPCWPGPEQKDGRCQRDQRVWHCSDLHL